MIFEDRLVLDKLLKAYDKAYYEGRPEQAVLLKEQIEQLFRTLPTIPTIPKKSPAKKTK